MEMVSEVNLKTLRSFWDHLGLFGTTLGRLWDKFECFSLLLPGGNRDENDEQEDKGTSTTSTHHLQ